MNKAPKRIKRLDRGVLMYFINMRDYKVCQTADWYFPTDDERWESGNYFPDAKAAKECAATIKEEYGERLETLDYSKEVNRQKFIKDMCALADKCKRKMGKAVEDDEDDKPKKKKPDFDAIAIDLVEIRDRYESRKKEINNDITEIREKIADIIKNYPK